MPSGVSVAVGGTGGGAVAVRQAFAASVAVGSSVLFGTALSDPS